MNSSPLTLFSIFSYLQQEPLKVGLPTTETLLGYPYQFERARNILCVKLQKFGICILYQLDIIPLNNLDKKTVL